MSEKREKDADGKRKTEGADGEKEEDAAHDDERREQKKKRENMMRRRMRIKKELTGQKMDHHRRTKLYRG